MTTDQTTDEELKISREIDNLLNQLGDVSMDDEARRTPILDEIKRLGNEVAILIERRHNQ